ncbi:SDR family NAD(P)-dependent oxidoreductase [Paenibacillus sp. MBLB4367]|uniref:SDR family NAD(P)-dependent oxidoreductase n=1 Tax=Paenibacillus sp. MBLB4367 TaxID=3384767 RepID=UPI0039083DE7
MRLDGKVALVTGGTLGIGRAIALRFAQEGAKVAVSGRGREALEETAALIRQQGGEALAIEADVQHKQAVDAMFDTVLAAWGEIHVLVNNAGICSPAPFLELTEEEWERHMAINVKGTFLAAQRAAKEMVKQGTGGSIINMSSVNGIHAEGDQAHYNASKGAINLLTMSMSVELSHLGIRTNALCPGLIETRLTRPLIENGPAIAEYLKTVPMKRVGQPEEIADAALFLASNDSRYMSGHCLVVDGGQVTKLS